MNFTPVDNNGRVEGYCLIRSVEVKSGKNGDYLDIVLNGADARYMIFETDNEKAEIKVQGFASRYYIKN